MRIWILPTVVVAIILAAAAPAAAGNPKQVPTMSRESFAPLPGQTPVTCSGPVLVTAPSVVLSNGVGAHLGKYSTVHTAESCELTAGGVLVIPQSSVETTANGDQIFFFGDVHIDLATGALTESYQITGGTGRFTGATGLGEAVGTVDLATGSGTIVATGTISTVGSGK